MIEQSTVRLLLALTILAGATPLAYGNEPTTQPAGNFSAERFVPTNPRLMRGATLELRGEATIIGEEVRLKQVCRWSDEDNAIFAPIGDLVLVRLGRAMPFRSISIDEIKSTLHDAGVNLGPINFVGTRSCTINRSDIAYDETIALQQWIEAKQGAPKTEGAAPDEVAPTPRQSVAPPRIEPVEQPADVASENPRTLRHLLASDLSQRLNLSPESLQIDFKPQDDPLLNLAEPQFRFQIEPLRVRNLGQVIWTVHLLAEGEAQKVTVTAQARAWQNQLLVQQPLAHRQIIRDEDFVERRALVEQLSEDPLLERHQVVGQQASRELKPGALLTARMVDPVPLVRSGQFVTISLIKGSVRVKTVARALEGGSYGQTIRVRNEATREIYEVTLTGPQTATFGGTHAAAAVDMADAISR